MPRTRQSQVYRSPQIVERNGRPKWTGMERDDSEANALMLGWPDCMELAKEPRHDMYKRKRWTRDRNLAYQKEMDKQLQICS